MVDAMIRGEIAHRAAGHQSRHSADRAGRAAQVVLRAGGRARSRCSAPGSPRAPRHPNAAKLFLDWALSREGQALMVELGSFSSHGAGPDAAGRRHARRSRPGIPTTPRSRRSSSLGPTTGTRPTIIANSATDHIAFRSQFSETTVLTVTRDMILPTTITGSYPRPLWFDRSLDGRSFKSALGDSLFREQYLDAVASIIAEQEAAGLDIVTDGDSRFDLTVGGKSWFFYPIERLGGIARPPRHLARLDVAPRPAPGQDPVGGAGGLSARRRAREAHARPAGIRRALAGRAAHDRPAGEVRRDLRARARRRCCGTSSTTTTRR